MSINWNNIRPLENSQNDAFEELVCQLARKENIPNKKTFIRKGKPDAGVECFWILENNDEIAWQAKFFTNSIKESQWRQIDQSIKTVLNKHPKLKKYCIAIPNDPSDARIKGQTSMQEKWDLRVITWKEWASKKGIIAEFIPWWSSDIIEKLQKPENVGLTYFWFNKEEFTDEWFREQTELSITDLGKRYTPELNLKLDIADIFNGISRNKKFKEQAAKLFDKLLIDGNKIIPKTKDLDSVSSEIQNKLTSILYLFNETNFQGIEKIPIKEFIDLIESANEKAKQIRDYYLEEENKLRTKPDDYRYDQRYGSVISTIREFEESANNLLYFLEKTTIKLANHPFLLLEGEAGVGKSHLLADIITERNTNNLISLFFLGQHFVTDEDPWTQIKKKNDIRCSVKEFLGALDSKAQISDHRIIIFIDAVNEGRGKYFWNKNINSFLSKIKKYKWLGVVMSIRTSYSDLIFPKNEITEKEIIRYAHYGFKNQEYEATKLFFSYYKIELPSIPLLHPEFQNPLFLILFCEGLSKAGCSKIPDGLQGITSIIDFFINSINNILSQPNKLNYPKSINVVKKSIESIVAYRMENHLEYVSYEQAFILVKTIYKEYGTEKGLLDELISEGILSQNLFWKSENQNEEGIYLAYERFEDHLMATYIMDNTPDLENAFKENGTLFHLVKDEYTCSINKGLLEALTIQVPEKTGKELYEYIPHVSDSPLIIECFIQSLLWRKIETTSEKLIDYVNANELQYNNLFLDTILSVTAIPNHYFNAYLLHRNLLRFSLADRDAWWTIYLKRQFSYESAVRRLIDWAWSDSDKSHILDESIKLCSISLAWFHTSTDRKLRDSATKALICILENRIQILIELLKEFEEVNDPYVYERLFAVAYGCAIRTEQKEKLTELSNYIFKTIFENKTEIYPHILLRDYARGVIEYSAYLGYDLEFDLAKVRPPYKSIFPDHFPSNEEIDQYKIDYKEKDFKNYYRGPNSILSSMTTEHGRGMGFYGDFGHYTFQRLLEAWNVDENALSNLAIKWIFDKYGYNKEKHGQFDSDIGTGRSRNTLPHERIRKKYQWIAMHEILARVSDNYTKYDWSYTDEEGFYQGPWEAYVRDIDPTILLKKTGSYNEDEPKNFWWSREMYSNWEIENDKWVKRSNDLLSFEKIISIKDESDEEWLVLEGDPEWGEPKKIGNEKWDNPHKRVWYQLRSYLVAEEHFEKTKRWALTQDFMGRWMPESPNRYEIFSREYYWSPAYDYSTKGSYSEAEESKIYDKSTKEFICKIGFTSNRFTWKKESDESKEVNIHFLKPSKHIFEKMKLTFSKREGEFVNSKGETICFDPSVNDDSNSYLLVKKGPFINYLKENKLKILWTVLGEKNIIGGPLNHLRGLEISGAYYLDENDDIKGNISTKSI